MSPGQFADHLFGVATGWLGWSPKTALRTPIPQIHAALRARIAWLAITNGHDPDVPANPADRIKKSLKRLQMEKK
jgi:hypothetical protein